MRANENNLERFLSLNNTQFVIPVYQRNYDWADTQCKQLLDDILTAGENEEIEAHFIGSVVYIYDGPTRLASSTVREYSIIDGQQRLTTITLIYIALYNLLKKMGDRSQFEKIHETYLTNKFASNEGKLKLRPTESDDRAIKHLLSKGSSEDYNDELSRVIRNYNYFRNNITESNLNLVNRGLEKLMFVEVSLERDRDDAQRIFESLNSTGLDLSQADLIRNFILMDLPQKEQIKIYDHFWEKIEQQAKKLDTNQSKVSDFIRDYLTLKQKKIPNKNKVYIEFRSLYSKLTSKERESRLEELVTLVIPYRKFLNPSEEKDNDIRRELKHIEQLEINVCFPFLMQVFSDYQESIINKSDLINVLKLIQSFVWRRFVVDLPTNALNRIFMSLYEDVDKHKYVSSIEQSLVKRKGKHGFPTDYDIKSILPGKNFYHIKQKNRTYFLHCLENHENNEPVQIEGNEDITIEHIFPQSPDKAWEEDLEDEDTYMKFKEIYLHTIGNLTLSGNNGSLGNRRFADKKSMNEDGKEQGYEFSRLWLNRYLQSIDRWDKKAYQARTEQLKERALQIWPYPDVQQSDAKISEEVNIFEAEDPTGKKLEYAIFADKRMDTVNITELYVIVMKELYARNPEPFHTSKLSVRLKLTKNQENHKNSIALHDDGYCIETNFPSQGKFNRIKEALAIYDAEDDLTLKYAD
ncbi:MAG: DUF262 domain-containing protein [Gammaproteobacteria bacterium]